MSISFMRKQAGIGIALLFAGMGICFSFSTPLWVPPDEDRHFVYCEYIANNGKLPYLDAAEKGFHTAQAIHPPLFYLLGSVFCKKNSDLLQKQLTINDGPGYGIIMHPANETAFPYAGKARSAHAIRLMSILFSALTVYLTYVIVLNIFPDSRAMAVTGALFVATNAQFLHIAASVSNEPLSTMLAALYLFSLLRIFASPNSRLSQTAAGVVLGLCLLTKASTIIYIPVTAVALLLLYRRNVKNLFTSHCLIMIPALLISGWWYARNLIVYHDPMFTKALNAMQPWSLKHTPLTLSYMAEVLQMTFLSFFGCFGSLQVPINEPHLMVYAFLTVLALAGLVKIAVAGKMPAKQTHIMTVMLVSILCGLALFIQFNIRYVMFMGRYFFVVIVPIAVVAVAGLSCLFSDRWRKSALIMIALLLTATTFDIFIRILIPAYQDTHLAEGINQQSFSCPSPEINRETSVGQIFISPHNSLSAIRVMFSNETMPAAGELVFTLKELAGDKAVCRITTNLKPITDFSKYFFVFPPIADSQGKQYLFYVESPAQAPLDGISLWYEPAPADTAETMVVNGAAAHGKLYFSTYHFDGDKPRTRWQGRQPAAINQGWYISLRELQYYHELAEDFQKSTFTHEKFLRFEQALRNRHNKCFLSNGSDHN